MRGYIVPKEKPQHCARCPYIDAESLDCTLLKGSRAYKTLPEQYKNCPLTEICTTKSRGMSIDQEKMIVESLSSIYPLQEFEEKAIQTVLDSLPTIQPRRGRWHYPAGRPATIGKSFGVICDQCGKESEYCTNFCGECGADMREATT